MLGPKIKQIKDCTENQRYTELLSNFIFYVVLKYPLAVGGLPNSVGLNVVFQGATSQNFFM